MTDHPRPSTTDRRVQSRSATHQDGWLEARGYGATRVMMYDLSENGAQVSAPPGLKVNDRVIVRSGVMGSRTGIVAWVDGGRVGLEFTSGPATQFATVLPQD